MKNYNMIIIERQPITVLSSGKIHKYDYLTGEEILLFNQQKIIEQLNLLILLWGKLLKNK